MFSTPFHNYLSLGLFYLIYFRNRPCYSLKQLWKAKRLLFFCFGFSKNWLQWYLGFQFLRVLDWQQNNRWRCKSALLVKVLFARALSRIERGKRKIYFLSSQFICKD